MMKILSKNASSFSYLEEVRLHIARLPTIDPNTRTILVCGFPNVSKSSFMNKITRAQVDVQNYAFTTKSLFVGHMDYKQQRYAWCISRDVDFSFVFFSFLSFFLSYFLSFNFSFVLFPKMLCLTLGRWQVIDMPGILDKPLEERNTIEMQSITALAHLRAAILYFVDISESCGYSIEQQVSNDEISSIFFISFFHFIDGFGSLFATFLRFSFPFPISRAV
jgi:nucleolar GTP-binding protein